MKKRTLMRGFTYTVLLIMGIGIGVGYSSYQSSRQQQRRFENTSLEAFAGTLRNAQRDMKESTTNPNTPLKQAYQDNVKLDIAQAWVLWGSMQRELIKQGLPPEKVQGVDLALQIVYRNILPPNGANPASVKRARAWISTFYSCLYPESGAGAAPSGAMLLSRLRLKISVITEKYKSYKSDGNFQVQGIFPG